jgi:acyl transferase domain-containing protein/pimeloyl-ACP methyl ester carboxylesterase/acyl carrier protein
MSLQNDFEQHIKEILKMIKLGQTSPQEGHQKIQELKLKYKNDSRTEVPHKMETVNESGDNNPSLVGGHCQKPVTQDIAIIGISGRFPGANDVEELWQNLVDGKSAITEVPKERWDINTYYSPDIKKLDKTNSRWGGFLEDIDKFDPLFFNISGMEAELTDPQQRLFMEECWKSLEDAGYANENISNKKCGVYVGAGPSDYMIHMIEEKVLGGGQAYWGNSGSVLASRISYFLNLKGPAVTIDTACSSSMVAIHLACMSILAGEIEMAIAGGVVVTTAPYYFVATSNAGMLSPDGKCKAFDNDANGIVNGEAVAAIVLKPLERAIKDGDSIYGVIKSSGVNQDGKTNGITAPSALSQTKLEFEVYQKGNINPETISYVEAHGTGTKLGDPVEIEALANTFRKFTDKKQFCAIGSIKTNIGHTAPAAGVTSVIKVLLALKYKKIPPSINFTKENEHIHFKDTPFYVINQLQDWIPVNTRIRRAAVSSFGFSGTNAHLVIEEASHLKQYLKKLEQVYPCPGFLIVLSARTLEQLGQQARQLLRFCEKEPQVDCGNMSYTLLLGRKHFNYRLACIVTDSGELVTLLTNWLETGHATQIYLGKVHENNLREQSSRQQYGNQCIQECQNSNNASNYLRNLAVIADLYVQGYRLEFTKLFTNRTYFRISLPTYPFARETYWAFGPNLKVTGYIKETGSVATYLHPLLHQNTSDFSGQRFSSTFTGQESFMTDHMETGQRILPGLIFLEMMRAAFVQAMSTLVEEGTLIRMKEVVWDHPVIIGDRPVQVHIGLFPVSSQEIEYEIHLAKTDLEESMIVCKGTAILNPSIPKSALDLEALQTECGSFRPNPAQCDEYFKNMGIDKGCQPSGIETVLMGSSQVLAKLSLSSSLPDAGEQFGVSPYLMNLILQAATFLMMGSRNPRFSSGEIFRPVSLQEITFFNKCPLSTWAWIRCSANIATEKDTLVQAREWQLDIDLCNDQGLVCAQLKGLSLQIQQPELQGTLLIEPDWKEQPLHRQNTPKDRIIHMYSQQLVFICESDKVSMENMATRMKEIAETQRLIILKSQETRIDKRFQEYVGVMFTEIQNILKDKPTGKVLVQVVVFSQGEQQLFTGFTGLLKTARLESSKFFGQLIELNSNNQPGEDFESIIAKLVENSYSPLDIWIRYRDGKRWIPNLQIIEVSREATDFPWKPNGIYLITGGAGGLGLIFAKEIARRAKGTTLILTGRSPLGKDKQAQLQSLETLGARVEYRQVDVTQKEAVLNLIQFIQTVFGKLDGIIHSAGLIHDNFILNKTREEMLKVLAPKVNGLVNLDEACQALPLDFIILFSSVAGVAGNPGQADYSTANSFLDAYARYRNGLVASKLRHGRTLSINWPLWKEGGMGVNEETETMMLRKAGTIPLQTTSGIQALYQSLAVGQDQILVLEGNLTQMKQSLLSVLAPTATSLRDTVTISSSTTEANASNLPDKMQDVLAQMVSEILKVKVENIDGDAELSSYGFDSLTLTEFVNKINRKYGIELNPTIFFEYPTLGSFTAYLAAEYRVILTASMGTPTPATSIKAEILAMPVLNSSCKRSGSRSARKSLLSMAKSEQITPEPIAIIGMSGIFPEARDLNEFWENLLEGKDCIREIPKERWDWRSFYGDPKQENNKTNIKWGGFIQGIDEFDSLFFGISPREAEIMDPQQRLLMTYIWKAIEDAGYAAKSLAGTKTGIFIGIADSGYGLLISKTNTAIENYFSTSMVQSMGPNRMSYYLNVHGPSEPVETACSSALVAINRAVNAMAEGACEMAIVGGINTILIPEIHISMSKAGALSEDGRCKTFSDKANGYVRGEGVGMLLLKKLKAAEAAGDHIYGVIRGITENHGGRANSLTAPNPKAQAELLVNAYTKAGIDPRTVTYIEAHGTGTELGDPVEINGLRTAFKELYQELGELASGDVHGAHCGLGSVKTNIGHLEIAAGIAGVIKVLLQMKHKTLVKSLHCDTINPYIKLEDSPFYIVRENRNWGALRDEQDKELPRRAGVSSFGFGGVNAHIVLEEYIQTETEITTEPQLIILSAKNNDRLKEYAASILMFLNQTEQSADQNQSPIITGIENDLLMIVSAILNVEAKYLHTEESLLDYGFEEFKFVRLANDICTKFNLQIEPDLFNKYFTLESIASYLYGTYSNILSGKYPNHSDNRICQEKVLNLRDLAYTLQVGREAMDERLAMVVHNIAEIKEKIQAFLSGNMYDQLFTENIRNIKTKFDVFRRDEDAHEMINRWIDKNKLGKIAELWVNGYDINWNLLHSNHQCRRLSLPTYPFAKERYWIPGNTTQIVNGLSKKIGTLIDSVDYGLSLEEGIVFTKTLNDSFFIVKDHNIQGLNIFPGVGYLEMVYQAVTIIKGHSNFNITRVFWMQPLVIGKEDTKVLIIFGTENKKFVFKVQSHQNANTITHVKGEIQDAGNVANPQYIDVEEIKSRCADHIKGENIYQNFAAKSMNYGPFFQGITEAFHNSKEAIAVLNLPFNDDCGLDYYSLHPTLLDSSLQIIGCIKEFGWRPPLPFAVENVESLHPLKAKMYAYAKLSGTSSYHVAIVDEDGRVCIKFYNVVLKEAKDKFDDYYFRTVWKECPIVFRDETNIDQPDADNQKNTIIIYAEDGMPLAEILATRHEHQEVHLLKLGKETKEINSKHWEIAVTDPVAMDNYISEFTSIDTIYFLGGIQLQPADFLDLDMLNNSQERGVMTLFRLIKAADKHQLLGKPVKIKIITNNTYQTGVDVITLPFAASIQGFIKSLAKEYPKLNITSIDIELIQSGLQLTGKMASELIKPIFTEPSDPNGETVVYRGNKRYERKLESIRLNPANETVFREQGVYLILGGAGGIGLELSRYLVQKVHARLVLIGRSELDSDKKSKLSEIEALGGMVLYHQADATDFESMAEAVREAKTRFGEIHGVFHSAMVSLDKTLHNMDEEKFRASLAPKVTGSAVLYSVLQNEKLDFIAFFSSTSAIVGMPGQSNYVSGLNFKDAFAKYISTKLSYPVRIINWGLWDIGAGASEEYAKRMLSQGIFAINSAEGMETIERVLSNTVDQVMVLKAERHVLERLGVSPHEEDSQIMEAAFTDDSLQDFPVKNSKFIPLLVSSGDNLEAMTNNYLKVMIAKILKMDPRQIDNQATLEQYGVDSLVGLELHTHFEKSFGELPPILLLENNTVNALTQYFLKNQSERNLRKIFDSAGAEMNKAILSETSTHGKQNVKKSSQAAPVDLFSNPEKNNFDFPVKLNSRLVEIGPSTKIEIVMEGSGPPLLLIPGFAVTTSLMIYQIRDWSMDYQVIAVNLPGHGRSDGIEDLSLAGIGKMIMNIVDKLEIYQPMHIFGGSFGGMIAQYIAKEHPERVATLSLLSSFTVSKFEGVSQFFSFAEAARKDFEIVKANVKSNDIRDHIGEYLDIFLNSQAANHWVLVKYLDYMKVGISTREFLPEIKAPTLVIVGALDSVIDPKESKILHSKLLLSQYFEIPDGGHFINLTHHQTINELVTRFLKEFENR